MPYEIVVHRLARGDVFQVYRRAAHNAPIAVEKWLARLQRKILTLQNNPQRCSFSTEDPNVAAPLFELLFDRAPNVSRHFENDSFNHRWTRMNTDILLISICVNLCLSVVASASFVLRRERLQNLGALRLDDVLGFTLVPASICQQRNR